VRWMCKSPVLPPRKLQVRCAAGRVQRHLLRAIATDLFEILCRDKTNKGYCTSLQPKLK
jgi:hypothetical protein